MLSEPEFPEVRRTLVEIVEIVRRERLGGCGCAQNRRRARNRCSNVLNARNATQAYEASLNADIGMRGSDWPSGLSMNDGQGPRLLHSMTPTVGSAGVEFFAFFELDCLGQPQITSAQGMPSSVHDRLTRKPLLVVAAKHAVSQVAFHADRGLHH